MLVFYILVVFVFYVFWKILKNTMQTKASYKLYAVRDEFVLLVAKGVLQEESPIFKKYYNDTNNLLQRSPNIGLDDVVNAVIEMKKNKSFEKSFRQSQKKVEEIHKLAAQYPQEVSEAIGKFYTASKENIVVHSSVSKLLYYSLVRSPLASVINNHIPRMADYVVKKAPSYDRFFKALNLAADEEKQFRHCEA